MNFIGWYAARQNDKGEIIGVWHRVESEIVDRSVMHCGREMKLRTMGGMLTFTQDEPEELCFQCAHVLQEPPTLNTRGAAP